MRAADGVCDHCRRDTRVERVYIDGRWYFLCPPCTKETING